MYNIIAIDGPSGSGKGTIAKEVAKRLNYTYIDTGAMYRAVAYKTLQNNINLDEYTILITADHGNCEQMINDDGSINTAHTTNLVPFILVDKDLKLKNCVGTLADIAPTILKIMGLDIPSEMTGNILIEEGE